MSTIPLGLAVRNKLPKQLEAAGYQCRARETSGRERSGALRVALQQAVQDYLASPGLESLVEISELARALAEEGGSSAEELEALRAATLKKEGGFDKGLVLDAVALRPEFVVAPSSSGDTDANSQDNEDNESEEEKDPVKPVRNLMPWETA